MFFCYFSSQETQLKQGQQLQRWAIITTNKNYETMRERGKGRRERDHCLTAPQQFSNTQYLIIKLFSTLDSLYNTKKVLPSYDDLAADEDSPRETEANEAHTRAFFAPSWKFLVLHIVSLVQTLVTSIMWPIRPIIWLVSPNIPKFKWGTYETQ